MCKEVKLPFELHDIQYLYYENYELLVTTLRNVKNEETLKTSSVRTFESKSFHL